MIGKSIKTKIVEIKIFKLNDKPNLNLIYNQTKW